MQLSPAMMVVELFEKSWVGLLGMVLAVSLTLGADRHVCSNAPSMPE